MKVSYMPCKVFPKCELLKICMWFCSVVGIFPWEFMFGNNKMLKRLYRINSNIMLSSYLLFISTQYIQLFFLIISPTTRADEISENVSLTFYYTITSIKQLIIKNSSVFLKIIAYIIETENKKSPIEDEETREIEVKTIKKGKIVNKYFIALATWVTIQYLSRPLFIDDEIREYGNVTQIIKHFPLSSWFPFDEQKYYGIAYLYQVIIGIIGAFYVALTDVFMFNLILFPTGQLKKLQHFFRNFKQYKSKIKERCGILDDDIAGQILCVDLIEKHKKIIVYINHFNEAMGICMVLDFIQSSIQMATIVTQLIGSDKFVGIVATVFIFFYFLIMFSRITYYYYFANDIIIASEQLNSAIWESNWYEQSPRTKFLLLMIMMRCKKPLTLNIGPFSVMSVQSAISILKASYSYIMLTIR